MKVRWYICQLFAYVHLVGMLFWYVCLCFPYLPSAVLVTRSRQGSESSLVCNRYSHLLLDDINDCKTLPICCDNSTATLFGSSWGERQWKMKPIMAWKLFPKHTMGRIQVSTLSLTRKIHCHLKAVEGEMVSIILSLIQESSVED